MAAVKTAAVFYYSASIMRKYFVVPVVMLLTAFGAYAHPMPASVMLLDVKKDFIAAELQWPLKEFQLVFPPEDIDSSYTTLIERKSKWLDDYLLSHFTITDSAGRNWKITVTNKRITDDEQAATGRYHELVFSLLLQPPPKQSPRNFIMHYDAIMHQLVTHKMFIKIMHDWYGGLNAKDSLQADLGMLSVSTGDGSIPPVVINLDEGSPWKGFKSMVKLGIDHIAEGTDHLLFLIVLLLPATLVVRKRRWSGSGGTKYSVIRLIKIATAFTIGHSFSLLLGALKWVVLPQQPVEVAIAVTILITAIHSIRPLFYGKEVFIAIGFGLIHGLAFATVLFNLNIGASEMAISILGFNIGIELMQLFVILCTVPWLIILSKTELYTGLRITGAAFAIAASVAWIMERITSRPNLLSNIVQIITDEGKIIVAALALLAIVAMVFKKRLPENEMS